MDFSLMTSRSQSVTPNIFVKWLLDERLNRTTLSIRWYSSAFSFQCEKRKQSRAIGVDVRQWRNRINSILNYIYRIFYFSHKNQMIQATSFSSFAWFDIYLLQSWKQSHRRVRRHTSIHLYFIYVLHLYRFLLRSGGVLDWIWFTCNVRYWALGADFIACNDIYK